AHRERRRAPRYRRHTPRGGERARLRHVETTPRLVDVVLRLVEPRGETYEGRDLTLLFDRSVLVLEFRLSEHHGPLTPACHLAVQRFGVSEPVEEREVAHGTR